MKLVTKTRPCCPNFRIYFNPHEREARDQEKENLEEYANILIHTSVKLVTQAKRAQSHEIKHFNPHEREARDGRQHDQYAVLRHFNPHEREARDAFQAKNTVLLFDFNPHEREARDRNAGGGQISVEAILIHTSVKLVTNRHIFQFRCQTDFNPHEREARDLFV